MPQSNAPEPSFVQEYLESIARDDEIHCTAIEWLADVAWGRGRVVLIGDAAHACSPMLGQGGCMAIEDAWVLAESFHAASDWPAALETFAARRTPRVTWVREQSRAADESFKRGAHERNAMLRECGDALLHSRYRPSRARP
jgi:2-polyprenyl-6-methoxyphenol hydroxylase-like FAD-dependent oxidoreductase